MSARPGLEVLFNIWDCQMPWKMNRKKEPCWVAALVSSAFMIFMMCPFLLLTRRLIDELPLWTKNKRNRISRRRYQVKLPYYLAIAWSQSKIRKRMKSGLQCVHMPSSVFLPKVQVGRAFAQPAVAKAQNTIIEGPIHASNESQPEQTKKGEVSTKGSYR